MKKKLMLSVLTFGAVALASCQTPVETKDIEPSGTGENSPSESLIESSKENESVKSSEEASEESSAESSEESSAESSEQPSEESSEESSSESSNESVKNIKKSFVEGNMTDFSKYEGTEHYVKVSTVDELVKAIEAAKDDYTTTWDDASNTYSQTMNKEGNVSVIEITQDINLGYNKLSSESKASSVTEDYCRKQTRQLKGGYSQSEMLKENGITLVKIERTNGLKIYSKNGSKLTHGGFQVSMSSDIEFANLEMDEMWQWEDANTTTPSFKVGDYDVFGWAYFKISFSNNIFIHNCSFGKSYDGQIDISDSGYWTSKGVAELRAPYGEDRVSNITIQDCDFRAGSDDPNGYIAKMMAEIEEDYQANLADLTKCKYQYYATLRSHYNLTAEQIVKAIALNQKKGFLCGDNSTVKDYNYYAKINFDRCRFTNVEDRLPKVRGGFVYMSNCIYDSTTYYAARQILATSDAKNIKNYNNKYKCSDTSQGIVGSFEADIVAENCVFIGIKELIKNNETYKDEYAQYTDKQKTGGFMLINCLYDEDVTGNYTKLDTIENPECIQGINLISVEEFNWHNAENERDIQPDTLDVNSLANLLTNCGVSK